MKVRGARNNVPVKDSFHLVQAVCDEYGQFVGFMHATDGTLPRSKLEGSNLKCFGKTIILKINNR